jgi:hypothetical protein
MNLLVGVYCVERLDEQTGGGHPPWPWPWAIAS